MERLKEGDMGKKWIISLALIFIIPGLLFTASCAKKTVQTETTVAAPEAGEDEAVIRARTAAEEAKRAEMEAQLEAERQKALEEQRMKDQPAKRAMMAATNQFLNEDIYFEFDSSALLSMGQDILKRKADWLRKNPDAYVVIEGHCDERGTNEYNLALGDRRASSAKTFLVDLGISGSRLKTISYGEERPVDPGHNEEAWAKNRRAHFVLE
jgi:peptidoglycan-associated lipoprotein